jgi:peptidoglycan hydrolase-like protein with peptidoglycan-binding domain
MANSYDLPGAVLAALLLSGLGLEAQQREKVATTSPSAAAPSKPAAPAKKSTKPPAKKPAPVPIGQRNPTRDRYREIQQALADAGHFDGPVDGLWGKNSVQALRNFQSAQGLDATGKIDAQTLIRLNLGPQYEQPDASESLPGSTSSR